MKIAKSKIGIITILMFLMLSMSASTILLPNVSAHNPPQNIPTYAFVTLHLILQVWVNRLTLVSGSLHHLQQRAPYMEIDGTV